MDLFWISHPIVGCIWSLNVFETNFDIRLVFPTLASPMITTLTLILLLSSSMLLVSAPSGFDSSLRLRFVVIFRWWCENIHSRTTENKYQISTTTTTVRLSVDSFMAGLRSSSSLMMKWKQFCCCSRWASLFNKVSINCLNNWGFVYKNINKQQLRNCERHSIEKPAHNLQRRSSTLLLLPCDYAIGSPVCTVSRVSFPAYDIIIWCKAGEVLGVMEVTWTDQTG